MSAATSSSDAVPAAITAPAGILQGVKTIGLRGRILGLAIGLMALGAVCGAVALSGLLTEKTKVNQVSTSFKDFRAERDAYEGWLTADDQTNMDAALGVLGAKACGAGEQIGDLESRTFGQRRAPLDRVAQLAYVAGPCVRAQPSHRVGHDLERLVLAREAAQGHLFEEGVHQRRDVLRALA